MSITANTTKVVDIIFKSENVSLKIIKPQKKPAGITKYDPILINTAPARLSI